MAGDAYAHVLRVPPCTSNRTDLSQICLILLSSGFFEEIGTRTAPLVVDDEAIVLYIALPLNERDRGGCTKAFVWMVHSAMILADNFIVDMFMLESNERIE